MSRNSLEFVDSANDPRLDPYRDVKDRDLAQRSGLFIAEAEQVVRRLLESDYPVESVVVYPQKADEIARITPPGVPIYIVAKEVASQLLGFKFHSGVLACGRRKTPLTIEDAVPENGPVTLVVCPETNNTENLGMIIRIAAGFGVTAMILGERCANPFYRQSIRVSMGEIFRLPIVESKDLLKDLHWLRDPRKVELIATVVGDNAEPLSEAKSSDRKALLFGAERHGLHPEIIQVCNRRVTIPMHLGTDSLNVHVAAAIVLYEFTQKKPPLGV
jgi:tRNA G18 (ribose-2'-O)-methylase SpoU